MKKLHILLAEDDELLQKVTVAKLVQNGHEVDVAHDGLEAVKLFNCKQFDCILMDIHMPNLNGIDAVKMIRNIEQKECPRCHTPIIAITTHPDVAALKDAGVDGYTQKPFTTEELTKVINSFLTKP